MNQSVTVKIPDEILSLMDNAILNNHRLMINIVGSNGHERIPDLKKLLDKKIKGNAKVLWCYHSKLPISSNREKRKRDLNKLQKSGIYDQTQATDKDVFFEGSDITYMKYSDSQRQLGQTFQMLILKDFSAIRPNDLARTIETVGGGGVIIILFELLKDIKQLHTVGMGYDKKIGGETNEIKHRFNERYLKIMRKCSEIITIDDNYGIVEKLRPRDNLNNSVYDEIRLKDQKLLKELKGNIDEEIESIDAQINEAEENGEKEFNKQKLVNHSNLKTIIDITKTYDQARTVKTIFDKINDKQLGSIIGITAARGRGKSAAIGLTIAVALSIGYTNIFVTAPDPSNVATLFEYILKGLETLGFSEGNDYHISHFENSRFVAQIKLTKTQYQYVTYIEPNNSRALSQCEILAIDEAAAIPLPTVKSLLGQHTTLLSSTIDGYEGTGRSLSLKLFSQLRSSPRFSRIEMEHPIRYSLGDPIERWLHDLLLLDVKPQELTLIPKPENCELCVVNRDILFKGVTQTEEALKSLVALSVASHYKNSPNDLILLSDAPTHKIFALCYADTEKGIFLYLAFLQVALEGNIGAELEASVRSGKHGGTDGNQIPWTISQSCGFPEFAKKKGIRVVRIAVHPEVIGKGYGSVALEQLIRFYGKELNHSGSENSLFSPVTNAVPDDVQYIGSTFGMTKNLIRFWKKAGFTPVYLSDKKNVITGEHSVTVLRKLAIEDSESWMNSLSERFKIQIYRKLPTVLKDLPPTTAEELLFQVYPKERENFLEKEEIKTKVDTDRVTDDDISRLHKWVKGTSDIYNIIDIIPIISDYVFEKQPPLKMPAIEKAVLIMIGKQMILPNDVSKILDFGENQITQRLRNAITIVIDELKVIRGLNIDHRVKLSV